MSAEETKPTGEEQAPEEPPKEAPTPEQPTEPPKPEAPLHPLLGGPEKEQPQVAAADNDQVWAVIAHASAVITVLFGLLTGGALCIVGPIIPLVIWLVFRERSAFTSRQALQATIFQALILVITVVVAVLGGLLLAAAWSVSFALIQVVVGLCLLPVALLLSLAYVIVVIGLPVAALVYGVYGAYEVAQGRDFNYWLVGDWVK